MLYSHNIENEKFNLFSLFLHKAIEGDMEYRAPVNRIIREAYELSVKSKDLYTIDRDSFPIIVFLSGSGKEELAKVGDNIENYNIDTYRTISALLK